MQFCGVESSAKVIPIAYPDQPLITVGESLPTERGVHQFRPELDVGLAQIEVVIAFRAHRARGCLDDRSQTPPSPGLGRRISANRPA